MLTVYRRVLRLYPADFRARFGVEMEQLVRDEIAYSNGVSWFRTFIDLAGSASVQRWKEIAHMKAKLPVIALIVIAVIGGTALTTGAIFNATSLMVACAVLAAIGLIAGISIVAGRRGAEHVYSAKRFRWFWVPAVILAAFQILFMAGQLISDPKWENAAANAVYGVFSALVFAGIAISNRRAGNWMMAAGVLPMLPYIWIVFPPVLARAVIVGALSDNVRSATLASAT